MTDLTDEELDELEKNSYEDEDSGGDLMLHGVRLEEVRALIAEVRRRRGHECKTEREVLEGLDKCQIDDCSAAQRRYELREEDERRRAAREEAGDRGDCEARDRLESDDEDPGDVHR